MANVWAEELGGEGDKNPLISFVGRNSTAHGNELNEGSRAPEIVALSQMVLGSLGMDLRHKNRGSSHYEFARAVARQHPGGMHGTSEGLIRSLAQQNVRFKVFGWHDGPLNKAAMNRLSVFNGVAHIYRRPRPNDLVRELGGLGVNKAAWVEVSSGLPDAGLETDVPLGFVILGGSDEKLKVHTPGNPEVMPGEGLYVTPENLLVPGSTLVVATRPGHEVMGPPLA